MLESIQLVKSFGDVTAVRGVSLVIKPGEIVGLVGASGSGKSTMLNLLAGLVDATEGTVKLNGERVKGPSEQLVPGHPHIKLVHQEYQLMPNVSIRENIAYSLRFYEKRYQDYRIDQLIGLCRLEAVQHRLPRQVSGGEKQRTAIARAIAEKPAVLLLDEPFSHLDLPNRELIRGMLLDLVRHEKTACLFVTHDSTDALSIPSRIGILQDGHLVQLGAPMDVYRRPYNAYVAQMTGPANLIRAKHLPLMGIIHAYQPNALACVRPEQIRLSDRGRFGGTVRNVFFKGAFIEVEVEMNRFVNLTFLAPSSEKIKVGQLVGLEMSPEAVHWMRGSAS
ncbi:ABC transporter ATP-binding protein [Larkinella rosea]|uniref:ABC transporter ATP-binding protein n=1 Tax=Larkinella rosea TaxID=2025312 RepID=A0A3P1C0E5_9BACT|nr:ABC transporter ATP-binding protein [Larkinella rosea]RRB06875.1 ABC transporter ATP-binding protein [Larkinella rosea]